MYFGLTSGIESLLHAKFLVMMSMLPGTSKPSERRLSEVVDLCKTIHASGPLPVFGARALGLFLCVRLTLTYLRHNPCQELLVELYGVWQATTSRVIGTYTPLIAQALEVCVPTVEDLAPS